MAVKVEKIISYNLGASPDEIINGDGVSYRYAVLHNSELVCQTEDVAIAMAVAHAYEQETVCDLPFINLKED